MKYIKVYVWWSAGRGDGDGYEDEIEVSDEQYEIFKSINCNGKDLIEISDVRLSSFCKEKQNELIDNLCENSKEYELDNYEEYCLNEDVNHQDVSFEEWWFVLYNTGVRIIQDFEE